MENVFAVFFLIVMEGLLSFDNALALAAMVRGLPVNQRKKALTYGIVGAMVFRIVALFFLVHVMESVWMKILGGAYLLWLALDYFCSSSDSESQGSSTLSRSFWMTIVFVELTDIAFSVDSILAAVAVSDSIYVIAIGGILGIIMMRFAATLFIGLIEKFPRLEDSAFILVFIVGSKLLIEAFTSPMVKELVAFKIVFWVLMSAGLLFGFSRKASVSSSQVSS